MFQLSINTSMQEVITQFRKEMEGKSITPASVESQQWFEEKISKMTAPVNRRALQSEALRLQGIQAPHVGRMYTFFYQPEGMFTLPYYDMFPVIFLMEMKKEYFQGLNLHYLPTDLKAEFYREVLNRANKKELDRQTFLRIPYEFLKSFRKYRAFKPCFKTYRFDNVRGRIVNIPSAEWEIVMNLPVALWRKSTEKKIHTDSRKIYRNG